ncbi:hypothetical protein DAEQUDRAFT_76933 [Daedalea quercina L-15889]|uniref:Uncharacterized protein n=1 Tax=Daedalea quercina L-15889 TaxID=1314783 RepID=A0A165SEY2_9APHY|nr:hypothetical protein DAEQUDRAFT_76933 [Daedalea quercina L-15889]
MTKATPMAVASRRLWQPEMAEPSRMTQPSARSRIQVDRSHQDQTQSSAKYTTRSRTSPILNNSKCAERGLPLQEH